MHKVFMKSIHLVGLSLYVVCKNIYVDWLLCCIYSGSYRYGVMFVARLFVGIRQEWGIIISVPAEEHFMYRSVPLCTLQLQFPVDFK
jgi:hypothetical protein